jgi:predicted AAA+ superfamily ATPase
MLQIEALKKEEKKNHLFIERKVSIEDGTTLLFAPHASGATSIIYDYLSTKNAKNTLYIDLEDDRVDPKELVNSLYSYIENNAIDTVVLEGYDGSFTPPDVPNLILTTRTDLQLDGFSTIVLYPLDFEEFIGFESSSLTIEHLFAAYLQKGTYPQLATTHSSDHHKLFQQIIKLSFSNEREYTLYRELTHHIGTKTSIFRLFNLLKTNHKLSKDSFYALMQRLIKRHMLFLVPKYHQPRGAKKLYFLDFTIHNAYHFNKEIAKMFENMIFLELKKRDKKLCYDDHYTFIDEATYTAYISAPFISEERALAKINSIPAAHEFKPHSIVLITMSLEATLPVPWAEVEIQPFFMWALTL